MTFRLVFSLVLATACAPAPATHEPAPKLGTPAVSTSAPLVFTTPVPTPPPPPTRCQVLASRLDERVNDAFTKANADALKAVREERDPLSKRLATIRAAIAKAKPAEVEALQAQIPKLEERRLREHPSRSDASLMGLDALRAKDLCTEGRDAAWATTLANVEVVPTDEQPLDEPGAWLVHAEHVVVRFDGTNETTAPVGSLVGALPKDGTAQARDLPPRDLDGDGASEWFLYVDAPKVAGTYRIVTFAGGAVRPYAQKPPMPITRIAADRNGMSFFHSDWLGAYKSCGQLTEKDVWGPPLAMELRADGSFSMTTPHARSSNWDFCQSPPERLYTVEQVVCAKLLGADTTAITARIRKENVPAVCDAMENAHETRNYNELYKFLLDAAKLPVPYATP